MKERIKNIAIILIGIISITSLTVSAATLIKSSDVVYDNTKSCLESTTVQGAVDELYSAATDYSGIASSLASLQTKVNNLEKNKQGRIVQEIQLPTPSITTDDLGNKILTYNVDLSGYDEVIPFIQINGYITYSTKKFLFVSNYILDRMYYYDYLHNNGPWSGYILIHKDKIIVETDASSMNISENYYCLISLFVR